MAAHAGDEHRAHVPLETRRHGPQDVAGVIEVDVVVDEDDVLELGEGGERRQRRLALAALVGVAPLADLQHRQVLAAAGGMAIDVGEHAGHGVLDEPQDAGLGRETGERHVLLAGAHEGLEDRRHAVRDGGHVDHRQAGLGESQVPRELGHGPARSGEHVLVHPIVADLALQHDLGAGDGFGADAHAVDELDGPAAQAAGHGQLVEAEGRGRRLERCRQVDGRVEAHAHGDGQGPAQLLGLRAELVDVPGRAREADGHGVRADQAHAMDGHVGLAGHGVLGPQQRHVEEGPRVTARARGRRQQPAQVERGPQDDLLAWRLARRHRDGRHRALQRAQQLEGQPVGGRVQQQRRAQPAGEHAGHDRHVVAADAAEEHGRADPGGRRHGRAGAHAPVDARQLEVGVDGHVGGHQLAGHPLQEGERVAQVPDVAGRAHDAAVVGAAAGDVATAVSTSAMLVTQPNRFSTFQIAPSTATGGHCEKQASSTRMGQ